MQNRLQNRLRLMINLSLIILLFLIYCSFPVNVTASPTEKHVLFLSPFTPDFPANELYNKGLKSILQKDSSYKFSYSYEYLDFARYSNDEGYLQSTAQYFKAKYLKQQPDFIITTVNLYYLLEKYGHEIFPNVPIIMDWNEDNQPLVKMPSNYIVIPRLFDIEGNVQLILKTRPFTKTIYLVMGDSADERNIVKRIVEVQNKYAGQVELVLLNKLPYAQMLEHVRSAEEHSAVLYLQLFSDVDGKGFVPDQVIKTICRKVNVPVYGIAIQYLGSGVIGGYVGDYEKVGQIAAQAGLDILAGKKPSDNPVIIAPFKTYAFDWRQLKRWGIDEHKLPSGSVIQFKETTVWEQYGSYIIGAIVLLMLQALLILNLLINRSKRKRTEQELLQVNKSLEQVSKKLIRLDRLKDEFLANTSHELRTPLNGIINITQSVLEEDVGNLTSNQKESLEIVQAAGNRLYNLINDILDIAKIKRGEITLDLRPVNLRMTASAVIAVLEFQLKDRDVYLRNEIPEDLPAVLADQERLKQIFYNLIGNAVKFTEKGHITIRAEATKKWLEISVQDTGIGIPEEKLADIFDAFVQVQSDASRSYAGTGLGLSITQKLVELHGGEIWARSELHKGTNFIFNLPKTAQTVPNSSYSEYVLPDPVLSTHHELANVEIKGSNGFSILAVDDDPANLRAITNILALEGYSVKGLNRGQAVLDMLENGCEFDLLLLDLMMPGMTGFEVLKTLRQRYSYVDLPVLILTARTWNADLKAGFDMGANDFLNKPFESGELRARVKTLVQLKALVNDKVTTELLFLQAQIKPHFIFNALSVISSLSIREPEKAKELVLDLSDYLRVSFDFENTGGLTTIRKELELVKAYLAIEQARFKLRLSAEFMIEEGVDCTIPMLSIQPLVENAVRHGIMPLIMGGKLEISVYSEGDFVKVLISDNGRGIEVGKVEGLLKGEGKKGSIGIKNIHRRLIALYGRGLEITGEPGNGTRVVFAIPYTEKKVINS